MQIDPKISVQRRANDRTEAAYKFDRAQKEAIIDKTAERPRLADNHLWFKR